MLYRKEGRKEGINNSQKVIMGTVAAAGLTAATISGILYTKGKNLSKEIDKMANKIRSMYEDHNRIEYNIDVDIKKVNEHIDEILKLPKKKDRLAKLKEIELDRRGDTLFWKDCKIDIEHLPKNIKEAVKNKDIITAKKLYGEYCDSLFEKSKVTGKTIEETVQNVFGKNSIVKPHTYKNDVNEIAINSYICGYTTFLVDKNNMVANKLNFKSAAKIPLDGFCSIRHVNFHEFGIPQIRSGMKDGRTYVTLTYDHANVKLGFCLLGEKGVSKLTKAQQDLKNLDISKLTKEDIALFKKLPTMNDDANYDAILSLVQTLSEKTKTAS